MAKNAFARIKKDRPLQGHEIFDPLWTILSLGGISANEMPSKGNESGFSRIFNARISERGQYCGTMKFTAHENGTHEFEIINDYDEVFIHEMLDPLDPQSFGDFMNALEKQLLRRNPMPEDRFTIHRAIQNNILDQRFHEISTIRILEEYELRPVAKPRRLVA